MKTAIKKASARKLPKFMGVQLSKIDYLHNPLRGIWKDRKEVKDSVAYVSGLRTARVKRLHGPS